MTKNQFAALTAALILSGWVAYNFFAGENGIVLLMENNPISLLFGLGFGSWMSFAFGCSNHQSDAVERAARKKNMKISWAFAIPHILMWGYVCANYDVFQHVPSVGESVFLTEGFIFGLTPMLLGFADERKKEQRRTNRKALGAI